MTEPTRSPQPTRLKTVDVADWINLVSRAETAEQQLAEERQRWRDEHTARLQLEGDIALLKSVEESARTGLAEDPTIDREEKAKAMAAAWGAMTPDEINTAMGGKIVRSDGTVIGGINCTGDFEGKCCGKTDAPGCDLLHAAAYRASRVDQAPEEHARVIAEGRLTGEVMDGPDIALSEPQTPAYRTRTYMLPDAEGVSVCVTSAWHTMTADVTPERLACDVMEDLNDGQDWNVLVDGNGRTAIVVHRDDIDRVEIETR